MQNSNKLKKHMKGGEEVNTVALNIVGSIKEIPKLTDNIAVKDNRGNSRGKNGYTKDFKEVFDKAAKDKFNNNIEKTNSKEDVITNKETIIKEERCYGNKELEEIKENNTEEIDNKIIYLLQGMINGEITLNPMELEDLSKELSSEVIEAIKESLGDVISGFMDVNKLNELNENLKNDILQILQSENIQGKSLEEIISKISEDSLKDIKDLGLSEGNKGQNLQAQIINVLKEKLLNTNPEKNLHEIKENLNQVYNESANLKINLNSNQNSNSSANEYLKDNSDEDKLLKELASGNKKDDNPKFDKVMNFMNSFNKIENSTSSVENIQKIIVNKNNFVNDMIKSVKFMEINNMKEMTVKIMPKELGEVVIKLTMENGLMKANITAQNKEAYSLLNSNLQELNDKFGGEIKIQNFTIDIYNGDTTFFSNEKNRQQNGQSTGKGKNSTISINDDDVQNIEHIKNIHNSNVNAFV